ncbi:hypothetical protein FKM82_008208 [Ascaphus truei]
MGLPSTTRPATDVSSRSVWTPISPSLLLHGRCPHALRLQDTGAAKSNGQLASAGISMKTANLLYLPSVSAQQSTQGWNPMRLWLPQSHTELS